MDEKWTIEKEGRKEMESKLQIEYSLVFLSNNTFVLSHSLQISMFFCSSLCFSNQLPLILHLISSLALSIQQLHSYHSSEQSLHKDNHGIWSEEWKLKLKQHGLQSIPQNKWRSEEMKERNLRNLVLKRKMLSHLDEDQVKHHKNQQLYGINQHYKRNEEEKTKIIGLSLNWKGARRKKARKND